MNLKEKMDLLELGSPTLEQLQCLSTDDHPHIRWLVVKHKNATEDVRRVASTFPSAQDPWSGTSYDHSAVQSEAVKRTTSVDCLRKHFREFPETACLNPLIPDDLLEKALTHPDSPGARFHAEVRSGNREATFDEIRELTGFMNEKGRERFHFHEDKIRREKWEQRR